MEDELGSDALHGHMGPTKGIEEERRPSGSSCTHAARHRVEGSLCAPWLVIGERDAEEAVGGILGLQLVACGLVVSLLVGIQAGRDGARKVEEFGFWDRLGRASSKGKLSKSCMDDRAINIWDSDVGLRVISKGQGGRGR